MNIITKHYIDGAFVESHGIKIIGGHETRLCLQRLG